MFNHYQVQSVLYQEGTLLSMSRQSVTTLMCKYNILYTMLVEFFTSHELLKPLAERIPLDLNDGVKAIHGKAVK